MPVVLSEGFSMACSPASTFVIFAGSQDPESPNFNNAENLQLAFNIFNALQLNATQTQSPIGGIPLSDDTPMVDPLFRDADVLAQERGETSNAQSCFNVLQSDMTVNDDKMLIVSADRLNLPFAMIADTSNNVLDVFPNTPDGRLNFQNELKAHPSLYPPQYKVVSFG